MASQRIRNMFGTGRTHRGKTTESGRKHRSRERRPLISNKWIRRRKAIYAEKPPVEKAREEVSRYLFEFPTGAGIFLAGHEEKEAGCTLLSS